MKLKYLKLRNVCQHKFLELSFPTGLVGIRGLNGAGKSNVLKMAYAALTNDYSLNDGTKADNINRSMPAGDTSEIISIWEHGGTEFQLSRGLSPEYHRLEISGEKDKLKDSDISSRLEDLLGMPLSAVKLHIFVKQGSLPQLLQMSPASRAKMYSKFCGTDKAEKLWNQLGVAAAEEATLVLPFQSSDTLKKDLEDLSMSLKIKAKKIKKLAASVLSKDQYAEANSILRLASEWSTYRKSKQANKAALKSKLEKYATERLKYARQLSEYKEIKSSLQSQQVQYREAKKLQELYKHRSFVIDECRKLEAAIEHQDRKLAKLVPVASHPQIDELKVLVTECAEKQQQTDILNYMLDALADYGKASCPVCDSELEKHEDYIDRKTKEVSELTSRVAELNSTIDEIRQCIDKKKEYDDAYKSIKLTKADLTDRLRVVQKELPPSIDFTEKHAKLISVYTALRAELLETRSELRMLKQSGLSTLEAIKALKQTEDFKPSKPKPTSADYSAAKKKLKRSTGAVAKLSMLKKEYDTIFANAISAKKRLVEARRAEQKFVLTKDWQHRLKDLRDLFHRDNLPDIVHRKAHEQWINVTNENLSDFGDPFSLMAGESLNFRVKHKDGTTEPGGRLSGGQMGVTAVSGQLALNELFAGHLGFLILDEPTDGMDDDNIRYLENYLERLAKTAKGAGKQIIVVTHEKTLKNVFDCVFTV